MNILPFYFTVKIFHYLTYYKKNLPNGNLWIFTEELKYSTWTKFHVRGTNASYYEANLNMEVRDIIAGLMEKYNLTETLICKRSGLHNSQLSRYLNQTNKKDIHVATLIKIIDALPLEAQSEFWWKMNSMSIRKNQASLIDAKKDYNSQMKVAEKNNEYKV
ncbi:MAG: helix-turn-helix transcriptional regulator [Cyanobacteria bacterium P01_G01_bin.39]